MPNGYCGKILHVDLTEGKTSVDEPGELFYRTYGGGPGIGLYYLLHGIPPMADPLGPENILIFAAGLLTGSSAPSVPRYTVCAKSPLTGALGKSEAGGWWGAELKMAGFDAVIFRGKASKPVYLWVHEGTAEIRDAGKLWGKDTGETESAIRSELGDDRVRIATIGQAGEHLVLFANIVNERVHFNGRNGLGAVMGSKYLKAIAVRGTTRVNVANRESLTELSRWVARAAAEHSLSKILHVQGTPATVGANNAIGGLPTHHWSKGSFESADKIGGDALTDEFLKGRGTCFACPIRCKRVIKASANVDPSFGGPEYETLAALGSNCDVGDLQTLCKANELCNRFGMDTISTGAAISFGMKCREAGIIDPDTTDGKALQFGDGTAVLEWIAKIAHRDGFGDILAEGTLRAAKKIGHGADRFLVQVKGQEAPMHDPRVKAGVGLQYALSPMGADHWFAQHDPLFTPGNPVGEAAGRPMGLLQGVPVCDLTGDKVRIIFYTSLLNSLYDALGACFFGFAPRSVTPLNKMVSMVQAITGWETNLWEMMKIGERINNMARVFNVRQGLSAKDDVLPEKYFEPLQSGPNKGNVTIRKEEFEQAILLYYEMAGWPNGEPSHGKLSELGLGWLLAGPDN